MSTSKTERRTVTDLIIINKCQEDLSVDSDKSFSTSVAITCKVPYCECDRNIYNRCTLIVF